MNKALKHQRDSADRTESPHKVHKKSKGAKNARQSVEGNLRLEFQTLFAGLDERKQSTKQIEATVPGEPVCTVETTLPSSFCFYPSFKKKALELQSESKLEAAVEFLRQFKEFIETGDEKKLPTVGRERNTVFDLTGDEDDKKINYKWQVNCGGDGWINFSDEANNLVEARFLASSKTVEYTGFRGVPYSLDFGSMMQKNLQSGYSRPVRRAML
mmetsp:Transcript_21405/g.43406  ORF Transcript_21405/g.43406 Transcript_21405/m.43406 type:complete len:214 (-) Transcript_21405:232-873(-)